MNSQNSQERIIYCSISCSFGKKLCETLDQGLQVDVFYKDYEKEFDHVDHGILPNKISFLGVTRKLLLLIETYLTDRTQQVKASGVSTSSKKVTTGVHQGSILGGLFFVIYSNDLHHCCSCGSYFPCTDNAKFITF